MKRTTVFLLILVLAFSTVFIAEPVQAAGDTETNAVAEMEIKFYCGCKRTGTGTMIAKNGMITCAHNLCCPDHNRKLESCTFYFGRNNKRYHYKYNGKFSYTYYGDYSNGYQSEDDIGYIVFPNDIGKNTGWYASRVESDNDIKWEYCHMIGYQGTKRVSDWNQVSVLNAKEITWSASSEFKKCGQGGPVYYASSDLEYPVLVAVYSCYTSSDGYARRLTNQVFNDMEKSGIKFNK